MIKPLVRHTDPGEAEGHQEGLLRSEVLQPVGSTWTPSAGNVGIVELRVKAIRSFVRHDQLAVLRGADPAVQLPVRYQAVVVVLLTAAYQPVSICHFRRNDRQGLNVTVRQNLRVLARHYSSLCVIRWSHLLRLLQLHESLAEILPRNLLSPQKAGIRMINLTRNKKDIRHIYIIKKQDDCEIVKGAFIRKNLMCDLFLIILIFLRSHRYLINCRNR